MIFKSVIKFSYCVLSYPQTKRKDMMFHLSESLQNHLSTLCQRLLSLEKASEEDGTKDEESSKTQLDAVEKYRAAFASVKEQLIKTQSVVKTLSQEVTDKVAMLRDDSIERIGEAYSEIQSISSTIDEIEAKQPSLFTSRNTKKIPFVWVVKDFSKLFEKSKQTRGFCYTSEPFFTGRFGYKLVARVYPNGVADGVGNYLSLVVVVMPGPYDMLLPWPIKNRVRLRAVNLGDRKKDKVTVVVFPQTGGSCQKPTSPKGNIGLGAIKFLGHGDVESEKFVIDDTMVFKIEVDYHSANI